MHGAADVSVDAAGGEDAGDGAGGGVVFVAEGLHDGWGLVDVVEGGGADVLGSGEAQGVDGDAALGLELTEEAADFVVLDAAGVFVVDEGDVVCSLEEPPLPISSTRKSFRDATILCAGSRCSRLLMQKSSRMEKLSDKPRLTITHNKNG